MAISRGEMIIPKEAISTTTAKEIFAQPQLWEAIIQQFEERKEAIRQYLSRFLANTNGQIILTGAGSSAFIGETIVHRWRRSWHYPVYAVPTTDLVTHPDTFFSRQRPTLLVSFARSGNSPESIHTVQLAEQLSHPVYHLIVTCNEKGELLQQKELKNQFWFVLPPESHDQALAMTGSFTGMALVGLLLADIFQQSIKQSDVTALVQASKQMLVDFSPVAQQLADKPFRRAVFLGSGPLLGIARESHLKLQELTDGQVMCQFDSFLGFRHGPRAVVQEDTLLVYLISPDAYARQYEMDLIREITELHLGGYRVAVGQQNVPDQNVDSGITISVSLPEDLWGLVAVLPAQMLGLFKSIRLGLNPDNPSRRGAISRVVQGVQLYSYPAAVGG